jgi:hypothetical protein
VERYHTNTVILRALAYTRYFNWSPPILTVDFIVKPTSPSSEVRLRLDSATDKQAGRREEKKGETDKKGWGKETRGGKLRVDK